MNKITPQEAFEIGSESCFKGLPSNPLFNVEFWERANKIDSHDPWKAVMNAYQAGWHEANKKKHMVKHHEC